MEIDMAMVRATPTVKLRFVMLEHVNPMNGIVMLHTATSIPVAASWML